MLQPMDAAPTVPSPGRARDGAGWLEWRLYLTTSRAHAVASGRRSVASSHCRVVSLSPPISRVLGQLAPYRRGGSRAAVKGQQAELRLSVPPADSTARSRRPRGPLRWSSEAWLNAPSSPASVMPERGRERCTCSSVPAVDHQPRPRLVRPLVSAIAVASTTLRPAGVRGAMARSWSSGERAP